MDSKWVTATNKITSRVSVTTAIKGDGTADDENQIKSSVQASSFSFKGKLKEADISFAIGKIEKEIGEFYEAVKVDQELISDYQRLKAAGHTVGNPILNVSLEKLLDIPFNMIRDDISALRQLADTFASKFSNPGDGSAVAAALQGLIDAIMGLLTPLTAIGFPELPIIGDLGMLLKKIKRIKEALTPEVKARLEEAKKDSKKSKLTWENILPKDIIDDILSIVDDVKIICSNLQLIPITLLGMAIMVLVNAVTKIFNTIGLGTFDFDGLMKASPINFDIDLDLSKLQALAEHAPNWTLLEALAQSIPMILMSLRNLPGMVWSALCEIVGDFCALFNAGSVLSQQAPIDAIIGQLKMNSLSCQLNIKCDNDRIDYLNLKLDENNLESQKKNITSALTKTKERRTKYEEKNGDDNEALKLEEEALVAAQEKNAEKTEKAKKKSENKNEEITTFKTEEEKKERWLHEFMTPAGKKLESDKPTNFKITEKAYTKLSASIENS